MIPELFLGVAFFLGLGCGWFVSFLFGVEGKRTAKVKEITVPCFLGDGLDCFTAESGIFAISDFGDTDFGEADSVTGIAAASVGSTASLGAVSLSEFPNCIKVALCNFLSHVDCRLSIVA